ncbi:MAG: hypothetical protein ACQEUZ_11730 [Pseudomonadota bacterium]
MKPSASRRALGAEGEDARPMRDPADPVQEDLAHALQGIEGLRRRIQESRAAMPPARARRLALALSMVDAALGEAVRELHLGEDAPAEG